MPDRPLTVLTYAASASLAAAALVYFFNPNYLIDGDSTSSSASTRKKGIVGLFNPANDCFINSILQALAGLGDLRLYLIRETHRRDLGGSEVYGAVPSVDSNGKEVDSRKLASLQRGEVTQGLKLMIDRLNERPIYKKTISAASFIRVLENAFGTKISKSQQDAQELLQILSERLSEEYDAGREARKRARKAQEAGEVVCEVENQEVPPPVEGEDVGQSTEPDYMNPPKNASTVDEPVRNKEVENDSMSEEEEEDGFPLEGKTAARTECLHCQFEPKATPTSFVMLNLMVPQKSSTTLDECLDAHFKKEFIDDYKCDKCRLKHAVEEFSTDLASAKSDQRKGKIQADLTKLQKALKEDPEKVPEGVQLPDIKFAPKRKIARHVEITKYPKVFVMHLSRSMYDPRSSSTKNFAKLSFPEKLVMGSLLNRRNYKLLGMVTHKGTHNSGHYETFRRQNFYAPFSTPHVDNTNGPYSASAITVQPRSKPPSPTLPQEGGTPTPISAATDFNSPSITSHSPSSSSNSHSQSPPSTRPSSGDVPETPPDSKFIKDAEKIRAKSQDPRPSIAAGGSRNLSIVDVSRFKRKKRSVDRWWRISDDKVKECRTSDVLSMQKEVYMLFYEVDKDVG